MVLDGARALELLEKATKLARSDPPGAASKWMKEVEHLVASATTSQTYIAFLGTAILAKATNLGVDVYAVKAKDGDRAYSARSIGNGVLAENALRLGIDLGVRNREPLNNQPFFGINNIREILPHAKNARVLPVIKEVLKKLDAVKTQREAEEALVAFVASRLIKKTLRRVARGAGDDLDVEDLLRAIQSFIAADGEYGRRAQAVAAGIADARFGQSRVVVSDIHDPDRHFPGDVGIRAEKALLIERAFEVRDKTVKVSDLYAFAQKCSEKGVRYAAVVAGAEAQGLLDRREVRRFASEHGVVLRVYAGWSELLEEALFYPPAPTTPGSIFRSIASRISSLAVSDAGQDLWLSKTRSRAAIAAEGED